MGQQSEEPRKSGFYWVTEHGCLPTVAYYRKGVWSFSGCATRSPDKQVKVLSPRLDPPASQDTGVIARAST